MSIFSAFSQDIDYLNYIDLRNKEAFKSYKFLFTFSQNEVYSPYFLTFQYTQLYLATKKGTNRNLASFALFIDDKAIHIKNTKLYQLLIPSDNSVTKKFKYSINIFLPDTLKYLKSYQKNFDSLIADTLIPYNAKDKNLAVKKINSVISKNTFSDINNVFDTSMISDNPDIISVSAATFDEKLLYNFTNYVYAPFYLDSMGHSIENVKYLYSDVTVRYAESPTYKIIFLPYEDNDFSLAIVLPKKILKIDTNLNFFNFETFKMWESNQLEIKRLNLLIPEFHTESIINLKPFVSKYCPVLFQKGANYTSLVKRIVTLTDIYQYSKFEIKAENNNLKELNRLRNKNKDEYFYANHPFIYFLINEKNHEVIFLGTFINPETK